MSKFLCDERVEWSFIPPRVPNHGGLWEAGVKAVKYHIKRIMGNLKFTYEEFLTILNQIEGILNSRPLYPLSCDPNDFDVLTPGHFLVGRPISAIVEPSLTELPDNRLKLFAYIAVNFNSAVDVWYAGRLCGIYLAPGDGNTHETDVMALAFPR
ncbi:uncharacterized protein LOC129958433 [Argiope bruennichi]|uniref:uncharacterized protein LOC129958433 n=1 Tax=Argiope bruennichi TaxID=94029 RepID=UPI0024941CF8|nr:uncharacterized protein LOC129958433 [Argiope bruennichi]